MFFLSTGSAGDCFCCQEVVSGYPVDLLRCPP